MLSIACGWPLPFAISIIVVATTSISTIGLLGVAVPLVSALLDSIGRGYVVLLIILLLVILQAEILHLLLNLHLHRVLIWISRVLGEHRDCRDRLSVHSLVLKFLVFRVREVWNVIYSIVLVLVIVLDFCLLSS